ncbi:arogenate dehydratase/prephenate dehydratase 2, chloroplastic-like [Daucus carota subsp. sativus]|uniref:arogenate dehydratase/prephenate dehydratase 2, chloroplastic-like n=1 Tax=Daucus carota subsp. sativus TaxID=79200 RepID=UPI0030832A7A
MSTREVDIAWEHCTHEGEGNKKRAKCNYCSKLVLGISRFKQHLARVGPDVTGCPNVPAQVSHETLQRLVQKFEQKAGQVSFGRAQSRDHQPNASGIPVSTFPHLKVAYKGIIGACSEEAVLAVYPGCQLDPCETSENAVQAVESHGADRVVIPIENSFGGSFAENYDLINSHQLHIVGEVEVSTNFCLLARPGVKLEQLKRVLGHPQSPLFPKPHCLVQLILSYKQETTGLVIGTAEDHTGVIGSEKAVGLYNLHIVARGIQDGNKGSITRFWILARDPIVPTNDGSFKTSLVFTLRESPKDVHKTLSVFATSKTLKLTKVVSSPKEIYYRMWLIDPLKGECFDYLFYVDFEVREESDVEYVVTKLKDFATSVRILGSYPIIEVNNGAR